MVLCVPDAPQVEEALFVPSGVAAGAARGTLIVDMSTISPVASTRFARTAGAARLCVSSTLQSAAVPRARPTAR